MKKLTKILISFSILFTFNTISSGVKANADENTSNNEIGQIYQQGKDKGIINNNNMPYDHFVNTMNKSVIPVYNNYKKIDNSETLKDYVSNDNYEVPYISPGDNPTETKAGPTDDNGISFKNYTNAKDGYNMHPGDILVVHGTDDGGAESLLVGHAAIVTSSHHILHMPGFNKKAEYWG